MNNKAIFFPGLNGLRAISAIAVVICHISMSLKLFNLDPYYFGKFLNGYVAGHFFAGYGVSIFFVLSGFLITYLLQTEKSVQDIDIGKFYLRRILRIWPLYYLYLFVVTAIIISSGFELNGRAFLMYIFYAANVPSALVIGLPFLYHYWSLGVEEQFYIIWPWINKKASSLILLIISLIAILIIIKLFVHFKFTDSVLDRLLALTRFQCMLVGALGAVFYKEKNVFFLRIVDNKFSQIMCWIILLLSAVNRFHIATVIDDEIISVVGLILIIGQIKVKNRVINLDTAVFDLLGKISYGIYVIHPIIILLFSKLLANITVGLSYKYFIVYFIILIVTIAIAYLLYTYFEKYFLKLKEKFVVVPSYSSKSFS